MLNIWNEFKIYYQLVKDNPYMNIKNVFSYIILKNTHARINHELSEQTAVFNSFLNQKKNFVDSIVNHYTKSILDLYKSIDQQAEEYDESVYEDFFDLYMDKYYPEIKKELVKKEFPNFLDLDNKDKTKITFTIDNKQQNIEIQRELFHKLKNYDNCTLSEELSRGHSMGYEFDEIDNLKRKIQFIKCSTLSDLIKKYPDNFNLKYLCKSKTEFENNKITISIYKFLKDDLINEDFFFSVNFFYEGALSVEDQKFVNAIKKNYGLSPDYHIDNPQNVINSLCREKYDININETNLNFYLLDYYIANPDLEVSKKLKEYLKHLSQKKFLDFFKWYDKTGRKEQKINAIGELIKSHFNLLDLFFYRLNHEDKSYFFNDFLSALAKNFVYFTDAGYLSEYTINFYNNWNSNKNNYSKDRQKEIENIFILIGLVKN